MRWVASLPTKAVASVLTVVVRVLVTHQPAPSAWAQALHLQAMPRLPRLATRPDHLTPLSAVLAMAWDLLRAQHTTPHRLPTRLHRLHTARVLPPLRRILPHLPVTRRLRPATRLRRRVTLQPPHLTAPLLPLTDLVLLPLLLATALPPRPTRLPHPRTAQPVLLTTLEEPRTRLRRLATARHRQCTVLPARHSKDTRPRRRSTPPTLRVKLLPSTPLLAPSTHQSKSRTRRHS